MSVKLIAMGNVLMGDDAVGIEAAKMLEAKLLDKNIEVIYGETDFQHCIANVKESDFVFIIDAASLRENPGKVAVISINDYTCRKKCMTQHSYSFLDLLKLYYANIEGIIFAIEVKEVEFSFGLSPILLEKLKDICEDILNKIEDILTEKFLCSNDKR